MTVHTTIHAHRNDETPFTPSIRLFGPTFAVVNIHPECQFIAYSPATLFALADAFLAAGQQLEHSLEAKAATAVNEANATTDAQPFGTVPTAAPLEPISVTA
jgi:hypothetical protein